MKKLLYPALTVMVMSAFTIHNNVPKRHADAQPLDSIMPVRGICVGAPSAKDVDRFVKFINEELAPMHINTLILRVEFNYQYQSHPELSDSAALSRADVQKMVNVCKKHHIHIIPEIDLLGHQSWNSETDNLLRVYPQFDETPWISMPENYVWPNQDNLYCKSYCPLHPEVHKIVFDLVDELCDVFEASAFHAGMDEVFYLGEDQCPRCGGKDKAQLFAGEVWRIRDHLAEQGRTLWIWGDRLLDGHATGLGMWEASYNDTYRAIDMIPQDVTICDWHYERPDPTAVYFAMKGFNVVTCPWRKPEVAVQQVNDILNFRKNATEQMKDRYQGIVETLWSDAGRFMDEYYGLKPSRRDTVNTPSKTVKAIFGRIAQLDQ